MECRGDQRVDHVRKGWSPIRDHLHRRTVRSQSRGEESAR
jgi:hypothetical protein